MRYRKTKDNYEKYLNDLYYGQDLWGYGISDYTYLNAPRLLIKGKLGTALRKHDPIAFNVGFDEWRPQELWPNQSVQFIQNTT